MIKISTTEVAILGLLSDRPMYGYEIEKIIEERKMRNWTSIGFSSIYYSLNKMEKKEFVVSERVNVEGKPSRKVFSITAKGESVLKEQISTFISRVEKTNSKFELGLMNLEILSKKEIMDCFADYMESIDRQIAHYEKLEKNLGQINVPFYIPQLATRPLRLLKEEKKWVADFVEEIKSKYPRS
jgi:DNA-binding PadR family transcriptional regulator